MPDPAPSSRPRVRCREITEGDLAGIVALLSRGFPGRPAEYWRAGLDRQRLRAMPDGVPRFGFMLDSEGAHVGVLLVVYSERPADGGPALRCNLASWYVEPDYRAFAAQLTAVAQRNRSVTFFNVTPAPPTWPIIEAQGFRRYCDGLLFAVPALAGGRSGRVVRVRSDTTAVPGLPDEDLALLRRHAGYGCLALAVAGEGGAEPFILGPFRARQGRLPLPAAQLIYARDADSVRRHAGTLGRYLLGRGRPVLICNANGPVPGLPGVYTERRGRKYVRGPHAPGLYDMTDSELVLFGA